MTNLITVKLTEDNELYVRYNGRTKSQSVFVALNVIDKTLSFAVNYEENSVPQNVFNGEVLWFGPFRPFKKNVGNNVLETFVPIAQKILDNHDELHPFAPLNKDLHSSLLLEASDLAHTIDLDTEIEDVYEPWTHDEYYGLTELSDLGLSVSSSDATIKKVAKYEFENSNYPLEGDEYDLYDYLYNWVEREREDLED